MNREKYIHVFLVAVLCYSQFIANIHHVGHIQLSDPHAATALTFDGHGAITRKSIEQLAFASHHDHSAHATDENESELDCTIYHALLSLNGVFQAFQQGTTPPKSDVLRASQLYQLATITTVESQPIRAPPAFS